MRLVSFLSVLALCCVQAAVAQTSCFAWTSGNWPGGYVSSGSSADPTPLAVSAMAMFTGCTADGKGGCFTFSVTSCSPAGAPTAANQGSTCGCKRSDGAACGAVSVGSSQIACTAPNACTAKAGQEAFVGGFSPPGNSCSGGCEVSGALPATQIGGPGGGSAVIYESNYTGNACSAGEAEHTAQCVSKSGVTACGVPGKNCGTFNGDQVCPTSLPPGTCQSFASGGIACTMAAGASSVPTPPGPNNGTTGTPAVPSGTVAANNSTKTVTTTTNYYSSSVVAASTAAAATTPTGTNTGNGGTAPVGGTGGDGKGNAGTECGNGMTSNGSGGCVGDSATGGDDCSAPPVCNGDPVECRILFETWASRCETLPAPDALIAQVGLSRSTGPTGVVLGLNPTASSAEDVKAIFQAGDTGGWLTRSCPADVPVDMGSYGTVTIPLSDKCWAFQLFGTLVLIIAYITAARIIVGGF
jgi:hypothetical protein